MINAIGEATAQQVVRANYNGPRINKQVNKEKSEQVRKQRPVETSEESSQSTLNAEQEQNTPTRRRITDGQMVVDKYDENGKLLKKTPPGYVPFGKIA